MNCCVSVTSITRSVSVAPYRRQHTNNKARNDLLPLAVLENHYQVCEPGSYRRC